MQSKRHKKEEEYPEIDSGDGFTFPDENGDYHARMMCCDCGLVHLLLLEDNDDGTYTLSVFRDDYETEKEKKR